MPRYFLNLDECGSRTIDDEGYEAAHDEAARAAGITAARGIMAEEVLNGKLCLSCRIEVTNHDGEVVLVVPFKEAVTVSGLT